MAKIKECQKDRLVHLMGVYYKWLFGDCSKTTGTQQKAIMWHEISDDLEEIGPMKTLTQWKKCWSTLKKDAFDKKLMILQYKKRTGDSTNCPVILSSREKSIINTCNENNDFGMASVENTEQQRSMSTVLQSEPDLSHQRCTSRSPSPSQSLLTTTNENGQETTDEREHQATGSVTNNRRSQSRSPLNGSQCNRYQVTDRMESENLFVNLVRSPSHDNSPVRNSMATTTETCSRNDRYDEVGRSHLFQRPSSSNCNARPLSAQNRLATIRRHENEPQLTKSQISSSHLNYYRPTLSSASNGHHMTSRSTYQPSSGQRIDSSRSRQCCGHCSRSRNTHRSNGRANEITLALLMEKQDEILHVQRTLLREFRSAYRGNNE